MSCANAATPFAQQFVFIAEQAWRRRSRETQLDKFDITIFRRRQEDSIGDIGLIATVAEDQAGAVHWPGTE